jgi:hypothetical protein
MQPTALRIAADARRSATRGEIYGIECSGKDDCGE